MIKRLVLLLLIGTVCLTSGCAKAYEPAPNGQACDLVEPYPLDLTQVYNYKDESYFDNTVFAGDSRVGIFWNYGLFQNTHLVWINSLTLSRINITKLDPSYTRLEYSNEDSPTLYQYLMDHDFENYYILVGINELGMQGFDQWIADYTQFLSDLKAAHPDRTIVVLLEYDIVNMLKSNTTPEQVDAKLADVNGKIIAMCQNLGIYYLDLNPAVCDENGNIIEAYTVDGVHLNKEGGTLVLNYLQNHIKEGTLYATNTCH